MNLIIDNTLTEFDETQLPLIKAFKLTSEHIPFELEVTLVFTTQDHMFNLNNQLRSKTQATDVLSLPLSEHSGEIFICPDYIFNQGYTNDRITHLWIHGLLHLAGYTHNGDEDFQIMSQIEIEICQKLGLPSPY